MLSVSFLSFQVAVDCVSFHHIQLYAAFDLLSFSQVCRLMMIFLEILLGIFWKLICSFSSEIPLASYIPAIFLCAATARVTPPRILRPLCPSRCRVTPPGPALETALEEPGILTGGPTAPAVQHALTVCYM